jgi:hypothetical protein
MRILTEYLLLAPMALLLAAQGCTATAPRQTGERLAWGEPSWGPPAEGLQCRLRADRRDWLISETPVLQFDLRNDGKRTFAFWPAQKTQLCEIEFDGKWRRWPDAVMIDSQVWPLAPGAQYNAVTIELDKRFGIKLAPGRHILRIAFTLEGVRVVSNSVGIKILAPK